MSSAEQNLDLIVDMMKALSDHNRVRALNALRKGELCLCQIIELLKLAPSTVSKHMSILKQAKLVTSRKDSRWVYYRLPDAFKNTMAEKINKLVIESLVDDSLIKQDDKQLSRIMKMDPGQICKNLKDRQCQL